MISILNAGTTVTRPMYDIIQHAKYSPPTTAETRRVTFLRCRHVIDLHLIVHLCLEAPINSLCCVIMLVKTPTGSKLLTLRPEQGMTCIGDRRSADGS